MSSIDNRIVEMEFNNKRFEENAKQTMSTLHKLKEMLNFKSATKELEDFQNASDSFNLSRIASAVEEIGNKFTLMGNLGYQAMQRIANAALNAGTALIKSISIDQISAGMSKYEQETNVIQTLYGALKPKGTQLSEIYDAMEMLTAYSDETSYSYTQMADAVSKFVNAGVDLKESEKMIEGISNAAALAGIGIHDTEIIYRNFSDAISKGGFRAADWKSIQVGHMDTTWLKDAFIEEAIRQGKLDKSGRVMTKAEKKNKKGEVTQAAEYKSVKDNFTDTLVKGWLDSDVIKAVMFKYANRELEGFGKEAFAAAQNAKTFTDVIDAVKDSVSTGWSKSFRIIFGDLEEAIAFFTPMANKVIEFTASIDEFRNNVLTSWKNLGGRDSMISALSEIWHSFERISDAFSHGFIKTWMDSFYPTWTDVEKKLAAGAGTTAVSEMGFELAKITKNIQKAAEAFNDWLTGHGMETGASRLFQIETIFQGIFSVINIIRMALGGVGTFFKAIFKQLQPTFDAVLYFFSLIGSDLAKLNKNLAQSKFFEKLGNDLAKIFEPLTSRLPKVVHWITDLYKRLKVFWKTNKRFVAFRKSITNIFKAIIEFIPKAIESLIDFGKKIVDTVKKSDEWKKLTQNYNRYIKPWLGKIVDAATLFNNALADFFKTDTSEEKTMWDKIKKRFSVFNRLGPWFAEQWELLKKDFPWLKNVEDWWNTSPVIKEIKEFVSTISKAFDAFMSEDTSSETSIVKKLQMRVDAAWKILEPYFTEKIDALGKWITETWEELKKKYPIVQWISDWIESSKLVQTLKQNGGNWIQTIQNFFAPKEEGEEGGFKGFIKRIKDMIPDLQTIQTFFQGLFKKEGDVEGSSFVERVKTVGSEILIPVWNSIKEWLKNLTVDDLLKFARLVLIGLSIFKTIKKIVEIGTIIVPIKKLINGLTEAVEEATGLIKNKNRESKVKQLIGVVLSVWLLVKAVKELGELPIPVAIQGTLGVIILLGAVAGMLWVLNKTSPTLEQGQKAGGGFKTLLSLIGVVMLVKTLTSAVVAIKDVDPWVIGVFGVVTALVVAASGLLIAASKGLKFSSGLASLLPMLGIIMLIKTFTASLQQVKGIDPNTMLMFGLAVDLLVLGVAGFSALLVGLGKIGAPMIKGAAIFAAAAVILAAGVALILEIVGGAVANFSDNIAVVGSNLSLYSQMVEKINYDAVSNSVKMIKELAEAFVEVGLKNYGNLEMFRSNVTRMGASLKLFNAQIPDFDKAKVDAIIGLIKGLSESFEAVGKKEYGNIDTFRSNVTRMASGLKLFSAQIQNVNPDSIGPLVTMLPALSDALVEVGGKEYGNVDVFRTNASRMGSAMKLFYLQTQDISDGNVSTIIGIIDGLSDAFVAAGGKEYGNLGVFRTHMSRMGASVKNLSTNFTDVDTAKIQSVIEAVRKMADDLSSFPEVGDLATSIGNIGGAIKLYSESVDGVSFDKAPDATAIKQIFDTIKEAIPQDDEALTEVANYATGDKGSQMTNFAIGLTNIATAVSDFAKNTETMDFDQIDRAVAALVAISKINTNLASGMASNYESVSEEIKEPSSALDTFATDLTNLGTAVGSFGESIKDTKFDQVDRAVIALEAISKINMNRASGMASNYSGVAGEVKEQSSGLDTFATDLSTLGQAVADFGTNVKDTNFDQVDRAVTALSAIDTLNKNMFVGISGNFASVAVEAKEQAGGLDTFATDLSTLGQAVADFGTSVKDTDFDQVDKAVDALGAINKLNTGLGTTVIANFGPFAVEVHTQEQQMSTFAEDIVALGTALNDFATNISKVSTDDLDTGVAVLGKIVDVNKALPKTGGISKWITGSQDLTRFAANLQLLGAGAKSFGESINGGSFDSELVAAAGDALLKITEVNKALPKTGGISSWLTGDEELGKFGINLKALGEGTKAFNDAVVGGAFDGDKIKVAGDALLKIVDVNKALPKTGGLSKILTGEQALGKFGDNLEKLGNGTKKFNDAVYKSSFDADKIEIACGALLKIVDLNKSLPETGGLSSILTGEKSLGKFADNLKELGTGAKAFSEAITGGSFNSNEVSAAGDALIKIAQVNSALPETGGISSWFTGDKSLGSFSSNLKTLGEGCKGFVDGLGDAQFSGNATKAINFIQKMSNIQVKFGKVENWYSLAAFGSEFNQLVTSATQANETLASMTLGWEDPTDLLTFVDGLADVQVKLGNITFRKSLKEFGQDFKDMMGVIYSFTQDTGWFGSTENNKLQQLASILADMLKTIDIFDTDDGKFVLDGELIVSAIAQGIGDDVSKTNLTNTMDRILSTIIIKVRGYEQNFKAVGTWIPKGLGDGIWENRYAAINAAIAVMEAAIDAAEDTAGVASPSKVFAEIGMYSDMGLAQGLLGSIGLVDTAAGAVSQTAVDTVLNGMREIQNLPLDRIETTPTIRPVLDTSYISSRARMIDGVLGETRTIGFNTRKLEAEAQLLGESTGSDISIISQQMAGLREQLDELKTTIANIKMVVDTGALVGAMESDIDKSLGARSRRSGRGN